MRASENCSEAADGAARWFARLRADNVTRRDRRRFDEWLDGNEANEEAFSDCTALWDAAHEMAASDEIVVMRKEALALTAAPRRRIVVRYPAAIAASLAVMLAGTLFILDRPPPAGPPQPPVPVAATATPTGGVYRTVVGQTSSITLADGSVVDLNTDSVLRVHLGAKRRRFALIKGQALFHVAHQPNRPFVVEAGGQSITALGTVFDVDLRGEELRVTLIEGQVRVSRDGAAASEAEARKLNPGQQLIGHAREPFKVRPVDVDQVVSWRSGRVVFDDQPLASVIDEINRYSRRKLVLGDPALAGLRVSGVFRTGSVDGFAAALDASFPTISSFDPKDNTIVIRHE